MADIKITLEDVRGAREVIKNEVRVTPLSFAQHAELRKRKIFFKQENFQITGSFKIRGALNKVASLTEEEKKRGVIAASAGNHAQGVAYSAAKYKTKCQIVMPEAAPLVKVSRTRELGAEVELYGKYFDEAFAHAKELAEEKGYVFVHPYQDAKVIAGQGTIGLEILEALPDVDNIIVPIGGGGLIGGISYTVKQLKPSVKIYGVNSDQAPGMMELKKGLPVSKPTMISTIADGIAVKNPSPEMFANYIDPYVEDVVAVSDEEIAQAIVHLIENEKSVTEGSGAAGLATVLSNKYNLKGVTCVLLCGGNIDLNLINVLIDAGLRKQGRVAKISTIVDDLPGVLASMVKVIAIEGANILDVIHDRVSPELALRQTRIDFLVETTSFDHIKRLKSQLRNIGVRILEDNDASIS